MSNYAAHRVAALQRHLENGDDSQNNVTSNETSAATDSAIRCDRRDGILRGFAIR
jgi:hypothetical protein